MAIPDHIVEVAVRYTDRDVGGPRSYLRVPAVIQARRGKRGWRTCYRLNTSWEGCRSLMDRATFFAIMGAFPTGVAIVTTMDNHNQPKGLTSNALCSVSAEPPLLLVSVDKNSNTLPALRHSQKFVVNYLSSGRGDLANLFASKEPDKFQNVSWRPASNGMPWLHGDTIAHAECNITQELDAGDHLVFIAQVDDGQPPAPGTKPLMYFRRTYGTWHE